jgi:CRISPR/Cas system-associated endonuclease Cas1
MLNYLYAVLESESRLALAALGLDPGIGVLHNDLRSRDSLACDLMEPIRPEVDAYLLDWLIRGPLKRDWFFEQRDGNCRLMGSFAAKLSESAPIWRSAVATFAEGIALAIWSSTSKKKRNENLSTPLTQTQKRESRGCSVALKPALV